MKRIDVVPLRGFDHLAFGTDRGRVRSLLGDYSEFRKSEFSQNTTDDFGFCHIYYDEENAFEAVEFFDDVDVFLDGEKIFPLPLREMMERIPSLAEDEDGAISVPLSIGVYVESETVACITFAKAGYFDYLNDDDMPSRGNIDPAAL